MSEKVKCPYCGAENYKTDTVCLNCGKSLLTRPEPPEQQEQAEQVPVEPRPQPKAQTPMGVLGRVVLVSVAGAFVEIGLVAWITAGPTSVYMIPLKGLNLPLLIFLGGLLYGVIRGLLVGVLLYLTHWSASVAMQLGGAIGLVVGGGTGIITVPGGLVAGFIIGLMYEQAAAG